MFIDVNKKNGVIAAPKESVTLDYCEKLYNTIKNHMYKLNKT